MKLLPACGLTLGCAAMMLSVAAPCRAETPPSRTEVAATDVNELTPTIEFARSGHDFGTHDAGEDLETSFQFKNTGTGVLRILNVKGG